MPDYRRYYIPGGTYFFTVVTYRRFHLFKSAKARALLGGVLRECQTIWPFEIAAIVLLHDHWHTIWALPPNDDRYSARMSWIKKEFTKQWLARGGSQLPTTPGMDNDHRRGIWQPRFWEHMIRDDTDFENHFHYLHYNPVKHGYVKAPIEWPYSSFRRWMEIGVYDRNWGCDPKTIEKEKFVRLGENVGEP
jgi:putative transposase